MENIESSDPIGILGGYAETDSARAGETIPEDEELLYSAVSSRIDRAEQWLRTEHAGWERLRLRHEGVRFMAQLPNDVEVLRVVLQGESTDRCSRDNVMHVAARAFVGKATRIIPPINVIAASDDRCDAQAATIMESWCDYIWRKESMKVKFKRAVDFFPWAGGAILHPYWDPQGGELKAVCPECKTEYAPEEEGQPCAQCQSQMDAAVEQLQQMRAQSPFPQEPMSEPPAAPVLVKVYQGEVKVDLIDPRDFIFDPAAAEVDDMLWCGTKRVMSVQTARKRWPKWADYIHAEADLYSERYVQYTDSVYTAEVKTEYLEEHLTVYEIHEAPTAQFPSGRILWIGNDRILDQQESPYWPLIKRHAFFPLRPDRRASRFWGEALGLQAEPLQVELDNLLTQMREFRELTINPKWLAPWNCGLSLDYMSREPGEIIKYNAMYGAPKPADIQPLPIYVFNEVQRLRASIREKYGVTEQEMGVAGAGQSGRAAAFLETQASEAVQPILIEAYDEWKELWRAVIVFGQRFMSPDRVWVITGQNGVRAYSWGKTNVVPGWDVSLVEDEALSKNPVIRSQQAERWLSLGVFNDNPFTPGVPNMKAFMQAAGIKLPSIGTDQEGTERGYAQAIPGLLEAAINKQGQPPVPHAFDNAYVIAEELKAWLQENRMQAPAYLLSAVEQVWYQYAASLSAVNPALDVLPNQALGQMLQQRPQQGQGAPPQQPPQSLGAGAFPGGPTQTTQQETALRVQQADQTTEANARAQPKHEGSTV